MSVRLIYRISIWLPLLVPAGALVVVRLFDLQPANVPARKFVQLMAASLLYGGIPYGVLAAWASWWITERPEPEINRLMFCAPLVMAGVFALVAVVTGIGVGRPGPFIAVAVLGAIVSVPLGYAYVILIVCLRRVYGSITAR